MRRHIVILVVALVLGLGYGGLSAVQNQNPHYPPVGTEPLNPNDEERLAWSWSPNPLWLPSFVLCRVPPGKGFGISHTRSGFMFFNHTERRVYFVGSTIVGGILGALAGFVVLALARKRKKKSVEP